MFHQQTYLFVLGFLLLLEGLVSLVILSMLMAAKFL
jgi:hypothetical protein